jgi:hypothetical protein
MYDITLSPTMPGNMCYQYGIILYLIVFFLTAIFVEYFKRAFMCKEQF